MLLFTVMLEAAEDAPVLAVLVVALNVVPGGQVRLESVETGDGDSPVSDVGDPPGLQAHVSQTVLVLARAGLSRQPACPVPPSSSVSTSPSGR